jgi:hypothetical protein
LEAARVSVARIGPKGILQRGDERHSIVVTTRDDDLGIRNRALGVISVLRRLQAIVLRMLLICFEIILETMLSRVLHKLKGDCIGVGHGHFVEHGTPLLDAKELGKV